MRNKYNIGELVQVTIDDNIGKRLGFIIDKDIYYKNYYIHLICGIKKWFEEEKIKRVMRTEEKQNSKISNKTLHNYRRIQNDMPKCKSTGTN